VTVNGRRLYDFRKRISVHSSTIRYALPSSETVSHCTAAVTHLDQRCVPRTDLWFVDTSYYLYTYNVYMYLCNIGGFK